MINRENIKEHQVEKKMPNRWHKQIIKEKTTEHQFEKKKKKKIFLTARSRYNNTDAHCTNN